MYLFIYYIEVSIVPLRGFVVPTGDHPKGETSFVPPG